MKNKIKIFIVFANVLLANIALAQDSIRYFKLNPNQLPEPFFSDPIAFLHLERWANGYRHPYKNVDSNYTGYQQQSVYRFCNELQFATEDKMHIEYNAHEKMYEITVHVQFLLYSHSHQHWQSFSQKKMQEFYQWFEILQNELNKSGQTIGLRFKLLGSSYNPETQKALKIYNQQVDNSVLWSTDKAYTVVFLEKKDPYWYRDNVGYREHAYFSGKKVVENEEKFSNLSSLSSVLTMHSEYEVFRHEFNHFVLLNIDSYKEQGDEGTYDYYFLKLFNTGRLQRHAYVRIHPIELAVFWWRLGYSLPKPNGLIGPGPVGTVPGAHLVYENPMLRSIKENDLETLSKILGDSELTRKYLTAMVGRGDEENLLIHYILQYTADSEVIQLLNLANQMYFIYNKPLLAVEDRFKRTPLYYSPVISTAVGGRVLLDNGADPNIQDSEGNTPLHLLCGNNLGELKKEGDYDIIVKRTGFIEFLVKQGAIVNHQDIQGKTPLHISVRDNAYCRTIDNEQSAKTNNVEYAKLLFQYKARPNLRNKQGNTALHMCAGRMQLGLCQVLIEHDADKTIKNNNGQTAFDIAQARHLKNQQNNTYFPEEILELLAP